MKPFPAIQRIIRFLAVIKSCSSFPCNDAWRRKRSSNYWMGVVEHHWLKFKTVLLTCEAYQSVNGSMRDLKQSHAPIGAIHWFWRKVFRLECAHRDTSIHRRRLVRSSWNLWSGFQVQNPMKTANFSQTTVTPTGSLRKRVRWGEDASIMPMRMYEWVPFE